MLAQGLAVHPLTETDLPGAMALVAECGWNQCEADWQLFVRGGEAFKVSAPGLPVAATAAILPHSPEFGWVSMVLVTGAQRRGGIATELLRICIDRLRATGRVPVLDATPAGREVYRQLGFRDGWPITRWRRKGAPADSASVNGVRALREEDWPQVAALDRAAFGADRTALLRSLAARMPQLACVAESGGRIAAFMFGREGRIATQIGPLVARDPDHARALLAHGAAQVSGELIVDALDRHTAFAQLLQAQGFAVERGYTRMALGAGAQFGDDGLTVAIAGPELG